MTLKTSFTFEKRNFLHSKLDELIYLWQRGSGQGTFIFAVNGESKTDFQFGIQTPFEEDETMIPPRAEQQHQHQQPQKVRGGVVRKRGRGPARQARNRERAARYQAAQAASKDNAASEAVKSYAAVVKFPGKGQVVGKADNPVLPIPVPNGVFFPSPLVMCTTLPSSTTTKTSPVTVPSSLETLPFIPTSTPSLAATPSLVVTSPIVCRDEVLTDSEVEDDELLKNCGHCLKIFEGSSGPSYCPRCVKCYHAECAKGHKCLSFL